MNTLQKMILSVVAIGFFGSYAYVLHAQETAPVIPVPAAATDTTLSVGPNMSPNVATPGTQSQISAPALPIIHTDDSGDDTEELTVEHSRNPFDDSDDDGDDTESDDD